MAGSRGRHIYDIFSLFEHLAFCDPKSSFGNRYGKIVDLDSVKLTDRHLDDPVKAAHDLSFVHELQGIIFQTAQ